MSDPTVTSPEDFIDADCDMAVTVYGPYVGAPFTALFFKSANDDLSIRGNTVGLVATASAISDASVSIGSQVHLESLAGDAYHVRDLKLMGTGHAIIMLEAD